MEVDTDKQPAEGEVLIFTVGGGFVVKGTVAEVTERLENEPWPAFELAENGDKVVLRSAQVVALRGGGPKRRHSIGFTNRT